jgi:hypothetical protein
MGARSRIEMALYEKFYHNATTWAATVAAAGDDNGDAHDFGPMTVLVFVLARDNGTMLRKAHLNATVALLDFLASDAFPLRGRIGGGFYRFCTDFCQLNEPIRLFTACSYSIFKNNSFIL